MSEVLEYLSRVKRGITPLVYLRTNGTVRYGPFQGMRMVSGDDYLPNQLLGLYESDLHPALEECIGFRPDRIVNVGSGSGYYGVGLARRCPDATVVMIDTNPQCMDSAHQNIGANEVKNVLCSTVSTVDRIEMECGESRRPFVFMDVEGSEQELLDPVAAPSLRKALIVVEVHPFVVPGILPLLQTRFAGSHVLQLIRQGGLHSSANRNVFLPELADMHESYKLVMASEGRPETMMWLYMTPVDMFDRLCKELDVRYAGLDFRYPESDGKN